jgi:Fic family protein
VQDDVDEVLREWNQCKTEVGEKLALEIFARYACVTSNELENVFEVEGSTWHRLVRKGFMENSIAGITENSKIKSKSRIIKILKNTNKCVDEVGEILSRYDSYDEKFICTLHSNLMEGENFEYEYDQNGIEMCIMVIPAGEFRKMGCRTIHFSNEEENEDDGIRVQYCKFSAIPELTANYCEQARTVLNNPSIDVFMKVAWLQWAFLCIHPFVDGNGRVARLISSLPLLKLFPPPVVVLKEKKQEYFNCLDIADRQGNLEPLRDFLRISFLEGIRFTRNIGRKPEPIKLNTLTKLRRVRSGSKSSNGIYSFPDELNNSSPTDSLPPTPPKDSNEFAIDT